MFIHFAKAAAIAVGVRLGTMAGAAIATYGVSSEHTASAVAVSGLVVGVAWDAFVGALVKGGKPS